MSRSLVLVKVDPRKVTVNESLLKPTKWDLMTVADDLRAYVSLSRVIKGMPRLRIVDEELVVINGLPFIHAARQAVPPINEVMSWSKRKSSPFSKLCLLAPTRMEGTTFQLESFIGKGNLKSNLEVRKQA